MFQFFKAGRMLFLEHECMDSIDHLLVPTSCNVNVNVNVLLQNIAPRSPLFPSSTNIRAPSMQDSARDVIITLRCSPSYERNTAITEIHVCFVYVCTAPSRHVMLHKPIFASSCCKFPHSIRVSTTPYDIRVQSIDEYNDGRQVLVYFCWTSLGISNHSFRQVRLDVNHA
jgi:hypothetical protein